MAIHNWNGHTIEVVSFSTRKGFWFTVAFTVQVDGDAVFLGDDNFKLRATAPFEIMDSGTIRKGQVVSSIPCDALRTGYRIMIEGKEVARGAVRAENWYITYCILTAMLGILCVLTIAIIKYISAG